MNLRGVSASSAPGQRAGELRGPLPGELGSEAIRGAPPITSQAELGEFSQSCERRCARVGRRPICWRFRMSENTSVQLLPTPPQFGRPTRPQRFLSPTPPKAPPSPVRSDAKRPTRRSFSFGRRKSAPAVPAQLADAYRANAKAVARGDWVCAQALAAQALPAATSYSSGCRRRRCTPLVTRVAGDGAGAGGEAGRRRRRCATAARCVARRRRPPPSSSAAGLPAGRRSASAQSSMEEGGLRRLDGAAARRLWGVSRSRGPADDPAAPRCPPPSRRHDGAHEMEGYLWKRQATQFKKRWFFLQSGILCYQDPAISDHAIVCGQVTSAVVRNRSRYELTLYTDQRAYEFRVEAEAELEAWIGACTRAAAKWMEG